MANETAMLETSRCFECGADTLRDGFMNRVSNGRTWESWGGRLKNGGWVTLVEGYICGPCVAAELVCIDDDHDDEFLCINDGFFDDDAYDTYLVERISEVDVSDPEARTWRERMERLSEGN